MIISKSKDEKYITELFNGKERVYSDVTEDKGGKGKYFSPHDFIEAGYAACLNITTRMILEYKNIKYENVTVNVELDKENEDRAIFKYKVDIVGEIDEKTKKRVLNILKNCPVRKTLSKKTEFEYCEFDNDDFQERL
ncbi:OsmC family protein [Clostridium tyrobutyricum]|uniref:OsmC family protein n=1 Tax=Clostridium tyrobutyricum TaxID=1519 RepID=UPI001C390DD6|nr:OsmC family protein [Clostridium tyrobutyricum]MBV4419999.1 OsmC family protein [Clostridium tyrobutyricum]